MVQLKLQLLDYAYYVDGTIHSGGDALTYELCNGAERPGVAGGVCVKKLRAELQHQKNHQGWSYIVFLTAELNNHRQEFLPFIVLLHGYQIQRHFTLL